MKRTLIAALALLAATTAHAGDYGQGQYGRMDTQYFRIQAGDGYMNVRAGPGTNHALLGRIPNGQVVSSTFCAPREDGMSGADWCEVVWRRNVGWVSRAGLMPTR